MWIDYSNSEVLIFHPVCEEALKKALLSKHMDSTYEVVHHYSTGTIIPDFVIRNKLTSKILCVIEVKRTKNDVQSARYQYQAQSYVSNIGPGMEKPYYVLTNLESLYFFRYDGSRPKPYQQILKPGFISLGVFSDYSEKSTFINKLSLLFSSILDEINVNAHDYLVTLQDFASKMESIKKNSKEWKSALSVFLYEYIRGSFDASKKYSLRDVRAFHNDVELICHEGNSVDFDGIFEYNSTSFLPLYSINDVDLVNLYQFARDNIYGDTVADILHSIVCDGKEHSGLVATDIEISRFVSMLAKLETGLLTESEMVCDPAAGSGALISCVFDVFNEIQPNQMSANDIEPQLLELLSLRLGLKRYGTLSKTNHPLITNKDIRDMKQSDFDNTRVVVLNPPYVAGINCVPEKAKFISNYHLLTGKKSQFENGQCGLELLFLEYVVALVKTGTIISCIMPKQYLTARGPEAVAFRKFLINDFGLCTVFNYSGEGLFDSVTKETCVLVGKTKTKNDYIKLISSLIPVQDLDASSFETSVKSYTFAENKFGSVMPGLEGMKVSRNTLFDNCEDGWRMVNSDAFESMDFVAQHLTINTKLVEMNKTNYGLSRGCVGNNGLSDLLFLDKNKDFYKNNVHLFTGLCAGIRNSDTVDSLLLGDGDSLFLNANNQTNKTNLVTIINNYLALPVKEGKQQKKAKTYNEVLKILNAETKHNTPANCVLIPRNLRVTGKIHITSKETYVSTNFVIMSLKDKLTSFLIGTWMTTIYYQLLCEIGSKDQEGTRKMEIEDIKRTLMPNIDNLTKEDLKVLSTIKHETFLNLQNPTIRDVDKKWSEVLFGSDYKDILNKAKLLLKQLATTRNS